MEAKEKSLRFLGESKALVVPFFQRHYVWREENWEELLKTFDDNTALPFLGSIILKSNSSTMKNEATIIDGQQRLTTITILAKAIFDCLPDDKRQLGSGIRTTVENFLFYRDNSSDDFSKGHVKIIHSRLDVEDYAKIMRAGLFDDAPALNTNDMDDKSGNIVRCYCYYMNALKARTVDDLCRLHDSMFNADRTMFVLIELNYQDINEQRIFDTINRAGVRLSAADIIKNNLFKLCLDKCEFAGKTQKDVCALYDEKWASLFDKDSNDHEMWGQKRIFGTIQKDNLEFLLYCVATIRWGKTDTIFSDLEGVYSTNTDEYTYEKLVGLINEIYDYAVLFKGHVLQLQSDLSNDDTVPQFKYSDHVKKLFLILEKFGVQMFYPYVLKRLHDVNDDVDDENIIHDFGVLESFVVRRRLAKQSVTDYAKKCDQILKQNDDVVAVLAKDMNDDGSLICDTAIKQSLNKINSETAKIVLFVIELYRRSGPKFDMQGIPYFITLEHIMPRKWKKNWHDIPICTEGGKPAVGTEQEVEEIRDRAIASLGNMTLISSKLNTSISNNKFEIKIQGDGPNRTGYKGNSSLLITRDIVEEFEKGKKQWDEKSIFDRSQKLLSDILNIWPNYCGELQSNVSSKNAMPEMKNPEDEQETEEMATESFSEQAFEDPEVMLSEIEKHNGLDVAEAKDEDDTAFKGFLAFIKEMKMSYSYKPVFLRSMLECANDNGVAQLDDVATCCLKIYNNLRMKYQVEEKENSVFSKSDCSVGDAKHIILIYPYDRFARNEYMSYDKSTGNIIINNDVWQHLDSEMKSEIEDICNRSIATYFGIENVQN